MIENGEQILESVQAAKEHIKMVDNRSKLRLSTEEIDEYNDLKRKILTARTSSEIMSYSNRAQRILEIGRHRYVENLE